MQVFDASSMIYAWDNYPIEQFPGLWEWIASQIEENELMMSVVALEEVSHKLPECSRWLMGNNLHTFQVTSEILRLAMQIKGELGIVGDNYHPKGVGENDLLIVATACNQGAELVSDEEKQTTLPQLPCKRKIPAVCVMPIASVSCINFIGYIRASGAIFR